MDLFEYAVLEHKIFNISSPSPEGQKKRDTTTTVIQITIVHR
jgi:hypothetical protein